MRKTSDVLFEYLKNILYYPQKAKLYIEDIDPEYHNLAQGLMFLKECMDENRRFTIDIAHGNLNSPVPDRENILAAPIKAIYSALAHMTWQTKEVAKGDYSQRMDFMGDFSDAFNTMVDQLRERQEHLEKERQIIQKKNEALEQNHRFLEKVTLMMTEWLVVMDSKGELLYQNTDGYHNRFCGKEREILIFSKLSEGPELSKEQAVIWELCLNHGEETVYYNVQSQHMMWNNSDDIVHILTDVTEKKRATQSLEEMAYRDPLTKLYNRRYAIELLEKLLKDNEPCCLCFVDIDHLKIVNDSYGHQEGDNYILKVAETCRQLQPIYEVCRVGGDEFVILFKCEERREAEEILESARISLSRWSKAVHYPYEMTFSYGVCATLGRTEEELKEVLHMADIRMYAYKQEHKLERL